MFDGTVQNPIDCCLNIPWDDILTFRVLIAFFLVIQNICRHSFCGKILWNITPIIPMMNISMRAQLFQPTQPTQSISFPKKTFNYHHFLLNISAIQNVPTSASSIDVFQIYVDVFFAYPNTYPHIIYIYMCVYVCICVCVCVSVCHACMHACMYVCMYVYMYVCLSVCMYVRTYVGT